MKKPKQPGSSWASSGHGNRKKREDGKTLNPQIKNAVMAEFAMNRIRREARRAARSAAPATRVFPCPSCGCPVLDSVEGRQRHVERSKGCKGG